MPTRTVLALATWAPLRKIRMASAIAANCLRDFIAEPRCPLHRKLTAHQKDGSDYRREFCVFAPQSNRCAEEYCRQRFPVPRRGESQKKKGFGLRPGGRSLEAALGHRIPAR